MARSRRVTAGTGFVVCLLAAAWATPRAQDAQRPPTFRGGVNAVRVDAVVTDKTGKPILDLTADDFEITEGGKRQQIDTFKFVLQNGSQAGADSISSASGTPMFAEDEAARDEARLFAIFLDDYHLPESMRQLVGSQVARFVEDELTPGDLVGVMRPTDLLSELRFTRDHEHVANEIRKFGEKSANGKYPVDHRFDNVSPFVARSIKLDVSFDAIQALIMRLGSLKEGRKALMVVSESYAGGRGGRGGGGGGGDDWAALHAKINKTTELANRHNTALYPVSPRLRQAPRGTTIPNEASQLLAEGSGGRAIFDYTKDLDKVRENRTRTVPHTSLAAAMKQVVTDMTGYYLLGYQSSLGAPDGKYHKIDLKVKRRGVEVRYRKGYWAATAADLAPRVIPSSEDSDVSAAIAALGTPRLYPIRTWIGMERGDEGKTRIRFSWEPTLLVSRDVVAAAERPARVTLDAARPGGDSYFSGDVRAAVAFDAPPGPLQLRIKVENRENDVLDRIVQDVTTTDFTAPGLLVGAPQVFRAKSAAELQRLTVASDALPIASRDFSRTDLLLVRVPAYAPARDTVRVTATLVGRSGQRMVELPVSAAAVDLPCIGVALAGLAPGAYAIRITVTAGDESTEEILAFRIIS